jgi:NAD-dependent deacetylase
MDWQKQTLTAEDCARMISNSGSLAVLSGAGISTAAGIPDFRGPQGLYVTRRYDPEKVFEIDWFNRHPEYFYEFSNDFVNAAAQIKPTFTHRFLASLEEQGILSGIVTQNIDLLHHLAGNQKIIELHGSYNSATCTACQTRYQKLDYTWWQAAMQDSSTPPVCRCSNCQGVLKPDIVFFGEMVDQMVPAERLTTDCDLLLVLGSSLQVYPAAHLPYATAAPTIVINKGEVMLQPAPNRYFIDADLDSYLQQVEHFLSTI